LDVNAELMNGRNPLHYAADYGHADVLEYLLSKGAKIDVSVRERVWWVTGWMKVMGRWKRRREQCRI